MTFRRPDPEILIRLAEYEAAQGEMVRVFVRGRRNLRAAVCFAGYPKLGHSTVTLFGTDSRPRATVRLVDIVSVQRVYVKAPKDSRWYERPPRAVADERTVEAERAASTESTVGSERAVVAESTAETERPVPVADAAEQVRRRVIRAELELDIAPALAQVEVVRKAIEDATKGLP